LSPKLGTIRHPASIPKVIVELQIAADFNLLFVFLNDLSRAACSTEQEVIGDFFAVLPTYNMVLALS
jgi:hypothetical protein